MIAVLVSAVCMAVALLVPGEFHARGGASFDAVGRRLVRFGPAVAAIVASVVVWYTWGEWNPSAAILDERSYLLQANIFASGRWTAPSPPLPEFFEQAHVQVVPRLASKYPPGHALLLAPGALVGFPALMPLLFTGLTAALIFALAARMTNVWVALLAWLAWLTTPIVLRFQPSYLSEVTTGMLVPAAWWSLLRWRDTQRRRWLLLLALLIGWGAITRPLTMLAFALPIGVVVLRDMRRGRWRDLGLALAAGVAVLAILPLWSARTTGDWRVTPLEKYRLDYLPFDRIGFRVDRTPPRRALPPPLRLVYDYHRSYHERQTLASLPETIRSRAFSLASGMFHGARLPLLPLAVVGLFAMPVALQFAVASILLLFLAHLPYAYWGPWTVYYLETASVVALLSARGAWMTARWLARRRAAATAATVATVEPAVALLAGVVCAVGVPSVGFWRRDHVDRTAHVRWFAAVTAQIPKPAILFVKYAPNTLQHIDVVTNTPDADRAPLWIVHDLGDRDAALKRLAPNRAAVTLEEGAMLPRTAR